MTTIVRHYYTSPVLFNLLRQNLTNTSGTVENKTNSSTMSSKLKKRCR